MITNKLLTTNQIRSHFTAAMSLMYQEEVPQYAKLRALVFDVNNAVLSQDPSLLLSDDKEGLNVERHGAIRLGTVQELFNMRRLFAVMGMLPVDYYDLSVAGIPVHSTAFRAIDLEEVDVNPFRVFTSLLRLDLIENSQLRQQAEQILAERVIFSGSLLRLIEQSEQNDGLDEAQAGQFINEVLEVFRWHETANVDKQSYDLLKQSHPLIADVVSFKGPHINHLTPCVLDIDQAQEQLKQQGFKAKAIIEGPPARSAPILLRQTSFIALEESVTFLDGEKGTHTARFGEVEQRGIALTPKGRTLYDRLLHDAKIGSGVYDKGDYEKNLKQAFLAFPDDHTVLRQLGLAYYRYTVDSFNIPMTAQMNFETLISKGHILVEPIVYEDFLPVSAAGIFQSNLDVQTEQHTQHRSNQLKFEKDLGVKVLDSFSLYEKIQQKSLLTSYEVLEFLGVRIGEEEMEVNTP